MTTDKTEADTPRTSTRTLAIAAVVVGALALVPASVAVGLAAGDYYEPSAGTEPPKLTDWMQGWGTIGAFIVGLAAAVFTGALLVHEVRQARSGRKQAAQERAEAAEDRKLAADERRDTRVAQARMVLLDLAEVQWSSGSARVGGQETSGHSPVKAHGTLRNFSAAPILDLVIELAAKDADAVDLPVVLNQVRVVGPGETVEFNTWTHDVGFLGVTEAEAAARICFVVRFMDAAGRRWARREQRPARASLGHGRSLAQCVVPAPGRSLVTRA